MGSSLPSSLRLIRSPAQGLWSTPASSLMVRTPRQRRRYSWNRAEAKDNPKKRVVILGSGWAGYAFARTLNPAKFERIIISPRSHFVFTPLLASTAVGTLEFRAVLEPIRRLRPVTFHQGWADSVDFSRRLVRVEPNPRDDLPSPAPNLGPGKYVDVPYDTLVVAVGAYSQTFGIAGVRQHAHFLRDVGDARRIRLRVLSLFEQAGGVNVSAARRRELLHFAVVGGGPTGVEFAAELHDLIHEDLRQIYPELLQYVKITIYDIASTVLPMFEEVLAKYAMRTLAREGIEIRTEHHLEGIREGEEGVLRLRIREFGEREVGAGLVVWSTGLMQNPLVAKLVKNGGELPLSGNTDSADQETRARGDNSATFHLRKDPKTGGILTDPYLRALTAPASGDGSGEVYVIGDCSVVEANPTLPKTAQVASQQAVYLAKKLNSGKMDEDDKPFKFRNWGTLAYLGNWKAIHQSGADALRGRAAWLLWRTAYLTKSMSIRNKVMVPIFWFISWLFGRDISRF